MSGRFLNLWPCTVGGRSEGCSYRHGKSGLCEWGHSFIIHRIRTLSHQLPLSLTVRCPIEGPSFYLLACFDWDPWKQRQCHRGFWSDGKDLINPISLELGPIWTTSSSYAKWSKNFLAVFNCFNLALKALFLLNLCVSLGHTVYWLCGSEIEVWPQCRLLTVSPTKAPSLITALSDEFILLAIRKSSIVLTKLIAEIYSSIMATSLKRSTTSCQIITHFQQPFRLAKVNLKRKQRRKDYSPNNLPGSK